jgi:hypothetical protein
MTSTARNPLTFPNAHRTFDVPLRPLRVSARSGAQLHKPADQKLVERVRREFSDLRGLSPTIAQARRLFHLADDECLEIFAQLLQEGFLDLCADDRYRLSTRTIYADFAK